MPALNFWMTPLCARQGVSEGPKWGKTESKAHTGPYLGPGWPGWHYQSQPVLAPKGPSTILRNAFPSTVAHFLQSVDVGPPKVLANCRQQNLFQRTKGDLLESVTKFAVSLAELEDGLQAKRPETILRTTAQSRPDWSEATKTCCLCHGLGH